LKGAIQTVGVGLSLDLFQFYLQRRRRRSELFQLKIGE